MEGRVTPRRRNLDRFPAEILIMIMKEMPDFATLHCLIVASNAALSLFEQWSVNKEILGCMRANHGPRVSDLDMKLALGIPWNMTDRLSDLAGIPLGCTKPVSRVQRASPGWLVWVYLQTNKRLTRIWHGARCANTPSMIDTVTRWLWGGYEYGSDVFYAQVHGRVATLLKANEIVSWLGLEFPRIEDWTGIPYPEVTALLATQVEYCFFKGFYHTGGSWLMPDSYLASALEASGYHNEPWGPFKDSRPLLNNYANHIAEHGKNDDSGTMTALHGSQAYPGTIPCRCS